MEPRRLVCIGEAMGLLTSFRTGLLSDGESVRLSFGGAESNTAIAAQRLGTDSAWISRLGRDRVGAMILQRLRAEGVRTAVEFGPGPTGFMIKGSRLVHQLQIDYHRSGTAAASLSGADIRANKGLISEAQVLHVTGITPALGPESALAIDAAMDVVHCGGGLVSFDINYRRALWTAGGADRVLGRLAAKADYVFGTEDEIRLITGIREVSLAAQALLAATPKCVVAKLGERGAVAHFGAHSLAEPAKPTTVVDPVGAGDAFVAGFLTGVIRGEDVSSSLDLATTVGAFAVSTDGDWEGLPHLSELDLVRAPQADIAR